MSANERTVRRSQTITPFGVGAIVDMLGESFVAEDISRWRGKKVVLRAPRIAAHFGVEELRTAPAGRGPRLRDCPTSASPSGSSVDPAVG